jgi:hypothetical protein
MAITGLCRRGRFFREMGTFAGLAFDYGSEKDASFVPLIVRPVPKPLIRLALPGLGRYPDFPHSVVSGCGTFPL